MHVNGIEKLRSQFLGALKEIFVIERNNLLDRKEIEKVYTLNFIY